MGLAINNGRLGSCEDQIAKGGGVLVRLGKVPLDQPL